MAILYFSRKCICRNLNGELKFTKFEVSDEIYNMDIVAVSKDLTRVEDPEKAEGPDWFTTDVFENLFSECTYV